MNAPFARLGRWIARHRKAVAALWITLVVVAIPGAVTLPGFLTEGSQSIHGSQSETVEILLRERFDNPFSRLLMVTVATEEAGQWVPRARDLLLALPEVKRVATYQDDADLRLMSPDGRSTVLMVGLKAHDFQEEQVAVPIVRHALKGLRAEILKADRGARLAVTGPSAIVYDIDQHSKRDATLAEVRALPLTVLILVLAFGALVAALLPVAIGVVSTTVAMALAFLVAQFFPLSNLMLNVTTMIGLAIGIDYALLMVSRFREALPACGGDVEAAVAMTVSRTGPAVLFSGLTVMIGLLGLFFSPLLEFRSMGLGGSLVVVVSILAAITFLPALLAILGPRVGAPRWGPAQEIGWRKLADWVMDRPWRVLIAATTVALILAWPATQMVSGFPSRWLPKSMEARTGIEILHDVGNWNAVIPIHLVVEAKDGKPIVHSSHLPALLGLSSRLAADRRVAQVLSPVDLKGDLGLFQYLLLYRDLNKALAKFPDIGTLFLSRDRAAALFYVIPADDLKIAEIQGLARDIGAMTLGSRFRMEAGGHPVYYNDFNDAMARSFPPAVAFVILVTLVVLFLAFKSYLLPIKAVLMNLLSVGAGYGAIVAVFQFGWGASWIGLEKQFDAIHLTAPMMIFCIVFGLSMDYEVFLLTRMKEIYDATGDDREATAGGLASTGSIITSAALIMFVVFGAFAFAEIALVKIIGVGLAVAVVVDAALIRTFLVPAVMRLAGRWNWVPGNTVKPGRLPVPSQSIHK